jgi:hypothetical protein
MYCVVYDVINIMEICNFSTSVDYMDNGNLDLSIKLDYISLLRLGIRHCVKQPGRTSIKIIANSSGVC